MTRRDFSLKLAQLGLMGSFIGSKILAQPLEPQASQLRASLIEKIKQIEISSPLKLLYPKGSYANLEPIIDKFTRDTGIHIETKQTDVDTINSRILISNIGGKYQFDVAIPASFGIPDLVEAGAIADLSSYAQKHEPKDFQGSSLFTTGDFYKAKFYGYQADGDTYVMFYNRAWLEDPEESKQFEDKNGYPLKIPETWVELDAMMAHFHRPDRGKYGGCLFRAPDYTVWEWWVRFHSYGSYPLSDSMEPKINSISGVKALEAIIRSTDSQHPSARTNGLFENWQVYAKGNCFANIGWGGTQKFLRSSQSQIRDKLAFGEIPGGSIDGKSFTAPYFNWGWNYVVSENSENKELAYLFTLYASTPEMSTCAIERNEGYFDPFRQEHYEEPSISKSYGEPFLKVHKSSMRKCIPDFYMYGYRDYFSSLKENINLALQGSLSPKLALDSAAKDWGNITKRIGRDEQAKQWQFLKSLYPEHLKAILG